MKNIDITKKNTTKTCSKPLKNKSLKNLPIACLKMLKIVKSLKNKLLKRFCEYVNFIKKQTFLRYSQDNKKFT